MAEEKYEVKSPSKPKPLGKGAKLGLSAALLAGIGVVAYPLVFPDTETSIVQTSGTAEFQQGEPENAFARLEGGSDPVAPAATFDIGPITDEIEAQRKALEDRNAALADQVAALQNELGSISSQAQEEQNTMAQQLAGALQDAQRQNAEALSQLQDSFTNQLQELQVKSEEDARQRDERITALQRENSALQTQIAAGGNGNAVEMEKMRLQAELERLRIQTELDMSAAQQRENDRQREELLARRAEAEAAMQARVKSDSVIFDGGSRASSGGGDAAAPDGVSNGGATVNPTGDQSGRAFVGGAEASEVEMAQVIANPSNTVLQGTMIEATLENAVDSTLPGNVAAVVNYPVYSFDGSRVLMPQGTKLFGRYSSDVAIGQGRILVSWDRAVTPEGQSVQMASYGGDAQGRSGITGHVNSRFMERFGGAALISLLGAAPSIAASQAQSEIGVETATAIADDLGNTTDAIIQEYASLPPIITVGMGVTITVMVDRDLEFF